MLGYGSLFTLCDQQFSMWFTCCSLLMTLISFMLLILTVTHQFSLFTLWGSCWALGFVFSCPRGQDTLFSFSLLPVVHEQVDMPNFLRQYDGFKKLPSSEITVVTATCHEIKVSYNMHQIHYTCNKYYCMQIQSVSK